MKNFDSGKDLRKQINLYFDNELGGEEVSSLLNIIDSDPRGKNIFDKEKNFRDYVKNNIKRPTVSSDLIQNIKNKINTSH